MIALSRSWVFFIKQLRSYCGSLKTIEQFEGKLKFKENPSLIICVGCYH